MFHSQLTLLKEMFQKDVYPEDFIVKCFKLFLNKIHIVKEKVPAVEKESPRFALLYLEIISLQTRTKLQKSNKRL